MTAMASKMGSDEEIKALREENARLKDPAVLSIMKFSVANELGHPDDLAAMARWLDAADPGWRTA